MKKYVMPAIVAAAIVAGAPALAADMPMVTKAPPAAPAYNPWDVAVGAAVMTDYNFRGISQSDRGAAVSSYFEGRFKPTSNIEWYAGVGGYSVKLATDPTAEIDLYGGGRFTWDKWTLDVGFWYYLYPHERQIDGVIITAPPVFNTSLGNTDFGEVYGKLNWAPNDNWAFSVQGYYAWDWLRTGADGTYGAVTLKYTGTALPSGWNWYVSGELGHYWLGTTDRVFTATGVAVFNNFTNDGGIDLPDYSYWNVGIGFTYKAITIDLRYHDTDLNKAECNVLTGDPGATLAATPTFVTNVGPVFGQSKWCGSAFIGKLSFDTTLTALK
jgi:uncharacterized protein (TIGR02001 family)